MSLKFSSSKTIITALFSVFLSTQAVAQNEYTSYKNQDSINGLVNQINNVPSFDNSDIHESWKSEYNYSNNQTNRYTNLNNSSFSYFTPRSRFVMVTDLDTNQVIYQNDSEQVPWHLASVTKMFTALTLLNQHTDAELNELLTVESRHQPKPTCRTCPMRYSKPKVSVGTTLTRKEWIIAFLSRSLNTAGNLLAENYPGGRRQFIDDMNVTAVQMGMRNTHFEDPTGLHEYNQSSMADLTILLREASRYSVIREASNIRGGRGQAVLYDYYGGRSVPIHNTSSFVRNGNHDIIVSKTGYIKASGKNQILSVNVGGKSYGIVVLGGAGRGRDNDIREIIDLLESGTYRQL